MSHQVPVIFYGYDDSPFAQKLMYILTLKNIPHYRVTTDMVLPRPELSDLLGIHYRRIPVLAIGNDVYCDTSLIQLALERRFPASDGYGTIFPPRKDGKTDTGMIKAFAQSYPEKILFPLAVGQLPWHKFKEPFLKDRADFNGKKVDPQAMTASQPYMTSILSSNLALLEEHLSDDREWLFDTELPGLGDVSIYFIYYWIRWKKDLFDGKTFPKSTKWLMRMTAFLNDKRSKGFAPMTKATGEEAAKLIGSSTYESYDVVGFDEVEAKRLGVRAGQEVSLAPDDTGKSHPTTGKLVGLNREEFVIETKGSSKAVTRCHMPRLGFSIRGSSKL